jgi:hypothetical protein
MSEIEKVNRQKSKKLNVIKTKNKKSESEIKISQIYFESALVIFLGLPALATCPNVIDNESCGNSSNSC